MLHHFILTRFNLPLWKVDKNGSNIDHGIWLKARLELFEKYTLPSVINQSCLDFSWIMLCDENTPVEYRDRIKSYREKCHRIELIQVEDGYAWDFPRIFSDVVTSILEEHGACDGDKCLTTYLDNDDALHLDYIARTRNIGEKCQWNTFISYDYGVQYFTELEIATCVKYPNNHFMTLVERVIREEQTRLNDEDDKLLNNKDLKTLLSPVRTCYGYGSHFLLEENGIPVRHVNDKEHPMWCEVVHKDNVDNDVKMTLDTSILDYHGALKDMFGVDKSISTSNRFRYYIRVFKQSYRRLYGKVKPRKWR